jgi:hypothetical protein
MNSTTRLQMANPKMQSKTFCIINTSVEKPDVACFEELFQDALDEVFCSLGEECRRGIYRHIEQRYGLGRAEIASHPVEFMHAIEGLFGQASNVLLIAIMRSLHCKVPTFKYCGAEGAFSFLSYLERLRGFLTA